MKELENDTILERIERLLGNIQSPAPEFGLSVFVLPPIHLPLKRMESDSHYVFFGKEVTEGTVHWIFDKPDELDDDAFGVDDILKELVSWRWFTDKEKPRTVDVAQGIVRFALSKYGKKMDKPAMLRLASNDAKATMRWVDDSGMLKLDFTKERVVTTERWMGSPDYALDNEEAKGWYSRANYWWIDVPDLTGLLGSILPVMYRFREKYLLDGMTKTEAVMWGLKKDIARNRLAVNTSNTQLSKWYGVNIHTIENAVAMLEDDERSLIPYGIESKKALNRSVRATKDSKWYENRKDQDKEEQQRERLTKLYRDYAGFSQNDAEDKVDGIKANKLQEEIESCMENLQ